MAAYRIIDRIGQGGMGIVYRAVQDTLDRPVAIKVLPASLMTSGTAMPRFLREIQACTKLTHPNIIRIIDTGEISGQPFYAMEFLEAQTLKELLGEAGPLPISQASEIFRQVLEALEYCHELGVIHRDIKPHNIMVDHLNHATLMDFGLVKMLERSGITHSRRIVGSPNYMSPEMIQGREVTSQADLWSLGCVMYELLTAERAFPGKAIRDIGLKILKEEPPVVTERRPDCPVGLAQVLAGCMKKEPAERYLRAAHVLKDLGRLEAGRPPLGPTGAASGESAPAVAKEIGLKARSTRRTATVPRGTRNAAAVTTTVVGLPGDPGRARMRRRLRSLLPQTWLERLATASLLVVGCLAVIALALLKVSPEREPDTRELAQDPRVERAFDALELSWRSAAPYCGSVRFTRTGPGGAGGTSGQVDEVGARTEHRIRLTGLQKAATYEVLVLAGERVLWRNTVGTLSALELVGALERSLITLDPGGLAKKLEEDLAALPPAERSRPGAKTEELRARHGALLAERLESANLLQALARFAPVRHELFLDPAVPAAKKRAVWMAVEALDDLRLIAAGSGVETAVPHALGQLKGAGYGPVAEFTLPGREVKIAFPRVPKGPRQPGLLHTGIGQPEQDVINAPGMQRVARLAIPLPGPLALPAAGPRMEVGLHASQLTPLSRVVLWLGSTDQTMVPVAVFRGPFDRPSWSHVTLDARLAEGAHAGKLEFRTCGPLTAPELQSTMVSQLVFRSGSDR